MDHPDPTPDPTEDQLGSSARYVDLDGDGLLDATAVTNADGTTDVFVDGDHDGIAEDAIRLRADGTGAMMFRDVDEDGDFDVAVADVTGNGVWDTAILDVDGDGHLDTVVADLDENGVPDSRQAGGVSVVGGQGPGYTVVGEVPTGPAVVGPATDPDPVYTLITRIAAETGQVAAAPVDSDRDGWPDDEDYHPHDDPRDPPRR